MISTDCLEISYLNLDNNEVEKMNFVFYFSKTLCNKITLTEVMINL